jgi:hypothetical protein
MEEAQVVGEEARTACAHVQALWDFLLFAGEDGLATRSALPPPPQQSFSPVLVFIFDFAGAALLLLLLRLLVLLLLLLLLLLPYMLHRE